MGLTLQRAKRVHVRTLPPEEQHFKESIHSEQFNDIRIKPYPVKRKIDLVLGAAGFLVYMLLFPFIALGIKLSSRGPVLFKQPRTGRNGAVFQCYKFRTMHVVQKQSKNGQPVVTQKGDNRIFGFGQFLRKMNLDELPQIINVMKGDMSLVGPRPYPVEECAYWNNTFDDHYYRYILTPGITGYAQARGLRGGTLDVELMRRRLDNDLIYIEKNSLKLDLMIIYRTVAQMVTRKTNGH
ncbi:capsular biosynthesis protein [Rhodohalobacter sp. SW132]|uniref:sugar transferase n=1 Tax=Rhodohalobacter sp. SW132 TaxID=2293433 RepID=UPI000E272290|nr:sugar transferase [Rhodohalobacter sp. SW132]REL37545.1 capsular biosynthesis protein [Rhodohalobacter sp. SW132]